MCVNGAIGDTSRIEVNKYWTKVGGTPNEF